MPAKVQSRQKFPRAAYRFQFNEHFRLNDALALVPYLRELGISHLYASPLLKAPPHSTHGYDACDFSRLNPEIGTEDDLAKLVAALRAHDMGLVLDIVPNHMGIGHPENLWWWDVMKNGRASAYAGHFDINWDSPEPRLRGKILVPILGEPYENILAKHELQLHLENSVFTLRYHEHQFPIHPASAARLPGQPDAIKKFNADPGRLDGLIQKQFYLLSDYREGDAKLNYRRFFAVSTLAALRIEDEKVFHDAHALIRQWYERGWIDGLRVDHPDGLRDPEQYLQRLRALAPDAWIVVEKILEPGESLPVGWPVAGTTGYDFLNQAGGIFVDAQSEKTFTGLFTRFTGETGNYPALVQEKKRMVLKTLLAAETSRLAEILRKIAARRKDCNHFTRQELVEAIIEMVAFFPVYRSYLAPGRGKICEADMAQVKFAAHLAREKRADLPPEIFALIQDLLLHRQRGASAYDFVYRFQQLTAPAMAKGAEDTAFYCFNRLVALNEVGGDPGRFGVTSEDFHNYNLHLHQHWPHSLLTTSTHDTKRSEDVRARLSLLSEIPDEWSRTVHRWSAMNECHRRADWPDRNAEYLFYQTLVGAWPLSLDRALAFMGKAVREAKQHTDWAAPNAGYEKALQNFISETLHDPEFTADLERFVSVFTDYGHINSLAQTLVKLTAPGVPDIYQGCELWDLSLVDPDNRRPVDFALRQRLLLEAKNFSCDQIWKHRSEGLPKLWVIRSVLNLRARRPELFAGGYQPLPAKGAAAEHLVSFLRGENLITVVPRFLIKLKNDWQDTLLPLPPGNWHHEFTGGKFSKTTPAGKLFQKFPVALLIRKENE